MEIYKNRRLELIKKIKEKFNANEGLVLLFAGFEEERLKFIQDSSFFYYTGLNEPGIVLAFDLNNEAIIFVPKFKGNRENWVKTEETYENYGIQKREYLGDVVEGYSINPYFQKNQISNLLNFLSKQKNIFTICPDNGRVYSKQLFLIERLSKLSLELEKKFIDISLLIAQMRQVKNFREIEEIYKAIDITSNAHEAALSAINDGAGEAEIHAAIEYVFTANNAVAAFPSIVGSGINSTILHYTDNNKILTKNEMVVVDIGAMYNHYCADLTRTYSSSKQFTKRQQQIFDLVLKTQDFIATIAQPGYWLNNSKNPDKSLHHLAVEFLKEKGGYDKYFIHGLGHHLGLDVHDVADYSEPLKSGEVFTIEPGIYIPDEQIGVRIEDNYWVVEEGVTCLSEQLPKIMF